MTNLPWLRLYTDTVDNEKIRLLAFEDRWHYIALLCLRQQGVLITDDILIDRKVAIKLGVQMDALNEIKRRLIEVGLINNQWQPVGWDNKQFKSDSSKNRTSNYRKNKKKKDKTVTRPSQGRHGDAIDTDTDTDTDTDKIKTLGEKNKKTVSLPDWLNFESWIEFVQHRKDIKKPLTDLAAKKNLAVLEKFKDQQKQIIDTTIANRWTGLFSLKNGDDQNGNSKPKFKSISQSVNERLDDIARKDIEQNGFTEFLD